MEWLFSVIVAISVIVSIISKFASNDKQNKQKQNSSTTSSRSSGGINLANEIKNQTKSNEDFRASVERLKIEKDKKRDLEKIKPTSNKIKVVHANNIAKKENAIAKDKKISTTGFAFSDKKQMNADMAKIIVLGEAINNPRFKKNYRNRVC